MPELMNHVEFRSALENGIKGKSANKAPFSIAWASGKLSRAHLASWAENHFHYVGPFADYLAYIYARMPDTIETVFFQLPRPVPVTVVSRITYDASQPVRLTRYVYRADRVRLAHEVATIPEKYQAVQG